MANVNFHKTFPAFFRLDPSSPMFKCKSKTEKDSKWAPSC